MVMFEATLPDLVAQSAVANAARAIVHVMRSLVRCCCLPNSYEVYEPNNFVHILNSGKVCKDNNSCMKTNSCKQASIERVTNACNGKL